MRKAARGDLADALARLDACGADAELVALARDCLAAEPEDRPRDAGVVAERITAYLAGRAGAAAAAERERAVAEARAVEERKRRVAGSWPWPRRSLALSPSAAAGRRCTSSSGTGRQGGAGVRRWRWPPCAVTKPWLTRRVTGEVAGGGGGGETGRGLLGPLIDAARSARS